MLPTFLGIGVPRSGTTWIDTLLADHPDVQMSKTKEIHFFDLNYERGMRWYERFFPERQPAPIAVGEYTPHYLYGAESRQRIAAAGIDRFVVALRHPVDRAVSHWRFRRQLDNYSGSFDEFLVDYPDAVNWCRYATHLEPWLDQFGSDALLVLVFETMTGDLENTKERLATFVGVDPERFVPGAGSERVNASFVPRYGRVYTFARRRARSMRRTAALAKKLGLRKAVSVTNDNRDDEPEAGLETRRRLWDELQPEVDALAALVPVDLSHWSRPQ